MSRLTALPTAVAFILGAGIFGADAKAAPPRGADRTARIVEGPHLGGFLDSDVRQSIWLRTDRESTAQVRYRLAGGRRTLSPRGVPTHARAGWQLSRAVRLRAKATTLGIDSITSYGGELLIRLPKELEVRRRAIRDIVGRGMRVGRNGLTWPDFQNDSDWQGKVTSLLDAIAEHAARSTAGSPSVNVDRSPAHAGREQPPTED